MATLIRFAGETDQEFERRAGHWYAGALKAVRDLGKESILLEHMRIMRLRESCGALPRVPETFTWDVYQDASD